MGMKLRIRSKQNINRILLNYKCKSGTVDDSNRCGDTNTASVESPATAAARAKYESVYSDIKKNLAIWSADLKQEERINRMKAPGQSEYKPTKDKWNAAEKQFSDARRHYIESLNGKIGRAPDSDQTRKLPSKQIESAEKLRAVSRSVIENASKLEKAAIDSMIIDSYKVNDTLIHESIPSIVEVPDEVIGEKETETTKDYVRNALHTTDDQLIKGLVGGLKEEYWVNNKKEWLETAVHQHASVLRDIKNTDSIMAKSVVPEDITVHSGVAPGVFPADLKAGDEFQLKSYLSTSRIKPVASGFARDKGGYVIDINLKKGTHALSLEDYQHSIQFFDSSIFPETQWTVTDKQEGSGWIVGESGKKHSGGNQREVLLGRNQKFRITKVGKNVLSLETA
jgi:hypothetical protein